MNTITTLLILLSSSISSINAFGTLSYSIISSTQSQYRFQHPSSRTSKSQTFVANSGLPTNGESPVVRSIDAKMQKMQKEKSKFEAKLTEYSTKLAKLQEKKNQYLNGGSLGSEEANFTESTLRSAVKAMMWRVIAGSVTFVTSLKFSNSLSVALKVVGSDFFSKAATMFIGERLMNKSQVGRGKGADSTGRSVAKALIWRLFAICNTLTVCFFVSKDFSMASKVAGSDAIFKTALMVVYERVWAKIEWGKEYQVDFFI